MFIHGKFGRDTKTQQRKHKYKQDTIQNTAIKCITVVDTWYWSINRKSYIVIFIVRYTNPRTLSHTPVTVGVNLSCPRESTSCHIVLLRTDWLQTRRTRSLSCELQSVRCERGFTVFGTQATKSPDLYRLVVYFPSLLVRSDATRGRLVPRL